MAGSTLPWPVITGVLVLLVLLGVFMGRPRHPNLSEYEAHEYDEPLIVRQPGSSLPSNVGNLDNLAAGSRVAELEAENSRLKDENAALKAAAAAAAAVAQLPPPPAPAPDAAQKADCEARINLKELEIVGLREQLDVLRAVEKKLPAPVQRPAGGDCTSDGPMTAEKIAKLTQPLPERPSDIITTPFDKATIEDAKPGEAMPDGTWGDDITINGYPLHFHHAWVGPYLTQTTMPAKSRYYTSSFLAWHPGWKQTIWDAKMVRETFPKEVVELLEQFAVPAQIRDILALMIPARFGGIFADADVWCMRSFIPLLRQANEGGWAANEAYSDAFCTNTIMASRPGHPIFQRAWQRAILTDNSWSPNTVTGPYFFRKMFRDDPMHVFQPKTFYPCGFGYPQCGDPRKFITDEAVFGVHQFEHTWDPNKSKKKPSDKLPEFKPMKPKIDLANAFGIKLKDPGGYMMCFDAWANDEAVIWGCGETSTARRWAYTGKFLKNERGTCLSANYKDNKVFVNICDPKDPAQHNWVLDDKAQVLKHTTAEGKELCATAEHKHGSPVPLLPCSLEDNPGQLALRVEVSHVP